jgi:L-rhamnose mutarotase
VRRVASVIRLRPEKEAEYRALHAHAWPGVLDTLRESVRYSISCAEFSGIRFRMIVRSFSTELSEVFCLVHPPFRSFPCL